MRKLYLIPCVSLWALFSLSACQKEVDDPLEGRPAETDKNILGTWKFIHSQITTEAIDEVKQDGFGNLKTIMTSDYTTTNNKGTVAFDATKMTNTDISYDVSVIAKGKMYEDGTLIADIDFPFDLSLPATSSVAAYSIVGDSLRFENGSLMQIDGYGMAQATPSSVHYRIDKDTLIITGAASTSSTLNSAGTQQTSSSKAKIITRLEK